MNGVEASLGWQLVVFGMAMSSVAVGWLSYLAARRRDKREEDYATKAEITRVDGKVDALERQIVINGENRRQAIEAKVEAARLEARQEAAELRSEIANVDKSLGVLQGETEMINQNVQTLTATVNRIADRQIAVPNLGRPGI